MISTRQFKLLYGLYSQAAEGVSPTRSIDEIASSYQVSTRTVRTDVDALAEFVRDSGMELTLDRSYLTLHILDKARAESFMDTTVSEMQKIFYFVDDYARAKYIVQTVLLSERHVKLEKLANDLFISQSRLSQDLKTVRSILGRYNLELEQIKGKGILIRGDTLDKRICLMREATVALAEGVEFISNPKYSHMIDIVTEVVVDELDRNGVTLSDITMQNVVVHVAAAVEMLLRGFAASDGTEEPVDGDSCEHRAAKAILDRLSKRLLFVSSDEEVRILATIIQGKREYDANDFIAEETNDMVMRGLARVAEVYGIDLSENLDLRIALGLHMRPLRVRLKHDAPVTNALTFFIKQSYSLPFEIATTFFDGALPEYAGTVTDDELSYLACHFATAVNVSAAGHENRTAVIVTREKQSGVLLLKRQIQTRFPAFARIDIAQAYNRNHIDLDGYDCIIVTDRSLAQIHPDCVLMNRLSIDEEVETRIAFAIAGFEVERDLISKFHRRLFEVGSVASKDEMIERMFSRAEQVGIAGASVMESIRLHEQSNSSFFGNGLAIPHSETLHSDCEQSFISVLISQDEVDWDGHPVNMGMLLVMHSEDPVRYQIWNYLSLIISKTRYVEALHAARTYEEFIDTVRSIFKLAL